MLAALGSGFRFQVTNQDAPSTTPGTSVVPGASNVEGSWTEVLSGAVVTTAIYALCVHVSGGGTSASSKQHLLDIGADPAGGTSYTAILSNLPCGNTRGSTGKWFLFPVYLAAGSAIAVRIQGSNATAGTVRVMVTAYGRPTRPELVPVGRYSETIGLGTSSRGTLVTPGVSGAEGSWTSLGTTTRALWWWQVGAQIDDTSTTTQGVHIDLAYGDASNKHIILQNVRLILQSSGETESMDLLPFGYCKVPAGATIYARISTSLATADSNYNVAAVAIGG